MQLPVAKFPRRVGRLYIKNGYNNIRKRSLSVVHFVRRWRYIVNLGENIYKNRTAKNWSQSDLAEALDVSRQSVSKWENNAAMPDLDKLMKMREISPQLFPSEYLWGRL